MSPVTHLVDTSAAARILTDVRVRERWIDHLTEGVVGMCEITELEMLHSARSLADRLAKQDLLAELFNWSPVPDGVYQRAGAVQRALTERGEHRSAGPVDLLVAATAELSGLTVLHYDADFETVARATGQATAWVAPPGGL
ncbi:MULTISPECIES: PIN domain nuclease [Streptomyces]|uniref:Ribonuclease VapC n=2 Tax=Streptomyces TaxID=1883 RepID=A0A100Y6K6_9ACTN|nr:MULTISPECIES: PIN domain nuclease [Streptomyces]KUH38637.1 twitching motility protein PilT [Streptomyces kanasensis]UUS31177.1 PIN domain nuclease [Streptomyces changanensis]